MNFKSAVFASTSLLADAMSWPFYSIRSVLRKFKLTQPVYNVKARNDLQRFEIDKNVALVVFWKNIPIGCGPAICLFIKKKEILKFDCFGPNKGHYHISVAHPWNLQDRKRETRLYFLEKTIAQQIDRAIFELEKNYRYYLQRHPDPRIRYCQFDRKRFKQELAKAKALMIQFTQQVDVVSHEAQKA